MKVSFKNCFITFVECLFILDSVPLISATEHGPYFVSPDDYRRLPKVFQFNDSQECTTGKLFCRFDLTLTPINKDNPPKLWPIMKEFSEDIRYYRRDKLFYAMCIQKDVNQEIADVKNGYLKDGFSAQVDNLYCRNSSKRFSELITKRDLIIIPLLLLYISFMIYCSKKTLEKQAKITNSLITIFSIPKIWKGIRKPNKNEDYNNLICIQGIRTVACILIITTHNYMFSVVRFSQNPEYVENIMVDPYQQILIGSFMFMVQIFFVLSSWLLALQLHNMVKKNGEFTIRDLLNTVIKRYFRLLPNLVMIIILYSSKLLHGIFTQPLYYGVAEYEINKYSKGWWWNLLYIQNIGSYGKEMYAVGTWYLAADTQMYVLSLALFYVSHKLKIDVRYFLGIATGLAVVLQIHTIMNTDSSTLMRLNPRIVPLEKTFTVPEFTSSYIRTSANIPSYMIGFLLGSVYSQNKQRHIFNTFAKEMFWYVSFIGVPLILFFVYPMNLSREMEFLMSIGGRPLFSLMMGIGILGMATKTGGYVKKFFECRTLVFLGDFTYSIYMYHFGILTARVVISPKLTYFSDTFWITNWIIDVILSFGAGIILYVIWEYPWSELQKIIPTHIRTQWGAWKTKSN